MKRVLSNSRTPKVLIGSLTLWLILGWAYGDDWLWTIARAVLGTVTIFGVAALYAAEHALARIGRVALGAILGAICARILGGNSGVVITVAVGFLIILLGCEYLIERDQRDRRSLTAS